MKLENPKRTSYYISKKIYQSKQVLEIEAAGFTIVAELLDLFITAVNDFHIHGKDLRKNAPTPKR